MTVSPAAFYVVAALVVCAAALTVTLPRFRHVGAAAAALGVAVAVLFLVSGAYAVAVLELVLTAVVTAVYSAVLLRREPYCRIAPSSPPTVSGWWLPAGAAIGFGALLLIPMALSSNGWASGHGEARLVTLLHYRAPYALIIAVVLAVTAAGAALLIGRTSRDEREHDRAANARHQREERTRRRREDRAAARRGRGGTRAEASE